MKLKAATLAITSVVAIAGFSGSAATAQSSGDGGQAPKTRAQCKKVLKTVDAGLTWENKRYAKALAKLEKRRAAATTKATALTEANAQIDARWQAIEAARNDQANPPSEEDEARLVDEYNSLIPAYEQNGRDLQEATDTLDGLKFEFSELKKNHSSAVRSTVKYRKQVATFCKKLKK